MTTEKSRGAADDRVDGRRERSRRTRRKMVEAAYRLFAARGYGVPLTDVAAEANVSVQNVYFAFHNKQALVSEALQLAVLGDDRPEPPHRRPWFKKLADARDASTALKLWVDNTLPIYARVAPLSGMFLSEPELADMWAHSEQLRVEGFREVMTLVATKGKLRPGVGVDEATDVMFVLLSPVVYQEFVRGRGWTPERWGSWVARVVHQAAFA